MRLTRFVLRLTGQGDEPGCSAAWLFIIATKPMARNDPWDRHCLLETGPGMVSNASRALVALSSVVLDADRPAWRPANLSRQRQTGRIAGFLEPLINGAPAVSSTHSVSRRGFLSSTAAIATAAGFPTLIPASALGRGGLAAPSERIRVGLIGCGNHGVYWNMPQIFRCPDAQIVAVCDVDRTHLADGQKMVDEHYGPKVGSSYSPCAAYGDFRKLILDRNVDVVSNHTPDHWHIIPAIMAVKCGKDVICEKPLTLFHAEGVALCKAVAEHNRVFQTASENRSIDVYIRLAELVRSGVLGKLERIEVGLPTGNNDLRLGPQSKETFNQRQDQPVPPELDYDTWLGQAPDLPYIPARLHGAFRWNLAFSGGVLTDWGADMIDLRSGGTTPSTPGR